MAADSKGVTHVCTTRSLPGGDWRTGVAVTFLEDAPGMQGMKGYTYMCTAVVDDKAHFIGPISEYATDGCQLYMSHGYGKRCCSNGAFSVNWREGVPRYVIEPLLEMAHFERNFNSFLAKLEQVTYADVEVLHVEQTDQAAVCFKMQDHTICFIIADQPGPCFDTCFTIGSAMSHKCSKCEAAALYTCCGQRMMHTRHTRLCATHACTQCEPFLRIAVWCLSSDATYSGTVDVSSVLQVPLDGVKPYVHLGRVVRIMPEAKQFLRHTIMKKLGRMQLLHKSGPDVTPDEQMQQQYGQISHHQYHDILGKL